MTGSLDGSVRVWNASDGTPIGQLVKTPSNLVSMAVSPDARRLLTIWSAPNSVSQLWDARTGRRVGPGVPFYGMSTYPAVFSSDGRRYLVLNDVNSVAIMDSETGERCAPLLRHEGMPLWFAFSPDERMVLTCENGAARVWDADSGEAVTPPLRHEGNVTWVSWKPDGQEVATASSDGSVRVWNVSPFPRELAVLERQAELLAGHRLDPRIGPVPLSSAEMTQRWLELRPAGGAAP